MKQKDIKKIVKAAEKDMAQECPDLNGALGDMLAKKAKITHTPAQTKPVI